MSLLDRLDCPDLALSSVRSADDRENSWRGNHEGTFSLPDFRFFGLRRPEKFRAGDRENKKRSSSAADRRGHWFPPSFRRNLSGFLRCAGKGENAVSGTPQYRAIL